MLQGKDNDKNYHICALHDPLLDEEGPGNQSCENIDILPSDRENSMDRDFINDDITDEAGSGSENSQESQSANDGLASVLENSVDRDFIKFVKKDKAGTESENKQESQSANDTESESENSQESQSAQKMLGEIINDLQRNTSQVST